MTRHSHQSGKEKCDWLVEGAHFDAAIDYESEDVGARLSELCPNGIDVFFDNVDCEVLNEVLARINLHARIVLCGSISKSDAATPQPRPANYSNLVARRARMEGFTSRKAGFYLTRIGYAVGAAQKGGKRNVSNQASRSLCSRVRSSGSLQQISISRVIRVSSAVI